MNISREKTTRSVYLLVSEKGYVWENWTRNSKSMLIKNLNEHLPYWKYDGFTILKVNLKHAINLFPPKIQTTERTISELKNKISTLQHAIRVVKDKKTLYEKKLKKEL